MPAGDIAHQIIQTGCLGPVIEEVIFREFLPQAAAMIYGISMDQARLAVSEIFVAGHLETAYGSFRLNHPEGSYDEFLAYWSSEGIERYRLMTRRFEMDAAISPLLAMGTHMRVNLTSLGQRLMAMGHVPMQEGLPARLNQILIEINKDLLDAMVDEASSDPASVIVTKTGGASSLGLAAGAFSSAAVPLRALARHQGGTAASLGGAISGVASVFTRRARQEPGALSPRQRLLQEIKERSEANDVARLERILREDLARPEFYGDDSLRLVVYQALRSIAGSSEPARWTGNREAALRARDILEEEWPRVETLSQSSGPEKFLDLRGQRDTLERVTDRIWRQLAYADLVDLREPFKKFDAGRVRARVLELQQRPDLQSAVREMATREMDTLQRFTRYFSGRGVGIVDETTFAQAPSFIPRMRQIFDRVLDAAGFTESDLFQLYFLNGSRLNAASVKSAGSRVLFETEFLQHELREGRLTEDLIAGILAHEIGHVISRLKGVLRTGQAPDLEKEKGIRGTAKSQAEEDYADLVAIKIVDQTGVYSLKGITRLFEELAAEDRGALDELLGMVSHPAHRMRFRDQTRHVLNAPYRNKNKPEAELDAEFKTGLEEFPGTFSSLRPLSRDGGIVRNVLDDATRLKNQIGSTSAYSVPTLKEHLSSANELLERYLAWLERNPEFSAWDSSWRVKKGEFRGDTAVFGDLAGIVAALNDNKPVSSDAELEALFQTSRARLDEAIERMRAQAERYNVKTEFEIYLGNAVFGRYQTQLPQEYERWSADYRAQMLRELKSPRVLLRKIKDGKVDTEMLASVLTAEHEALKGELGPGGFFEILAATLSGLREDSARDRRIVEWVRDAAGTVLAWPLVFRVLVALPRNSLNNVVYPYDQQQRRNVYDPSNPVNEIRARALAGGEDSKRAFLDWALNYGEDYYLDTLSQLEREAQKREILALFSGPDLADRFSLLLKILKVYLPKYDWIRDADLMQSLFTAIGSIHGTRKDSRLEQRLELSESLFEALWAANMGKAEGERKSAPEFIKDFFRAGGMVSPRALEDFIGFRDAYGSRPAKVKTAEEMAGLRQFFEENMDGILDEWRRSSSYQGTFRGLSLEEVAQHYRMILGLREMELAHPDLAVNRFSDGYVTFQQPFSDRPFINNAYAHLGDALRTRVSQSMHPDQKYLEEMAHAFPFLDNPMTYEQTVSMLETYLPKSIYRTYALTLALAVKKLGLPVERAFDREAVGKALAEMSAEERMEAVTKIVALADYDRVTASQNSALSGRFMFDQRKGLIMTRSEEEAHRREFGKFQNAYFMSSWQDIGDRAETQMDLFLISLAEEIDLRGLLENFLESQQDPDPAKDLAAKVKRVEDIFTRPSSARDLYLSRLGEAVLGSKQPAAVKLALINDLARNHLHGAQVKQGFELRALDLEATLLLEQFRAGAITREDLLERVPAKITEYFPAPGPIRDDLLDSFIEKHVETVPEFRRLASLYSTVYASEGRALESRQIEGEGEASRNMALFVLSNLPEPTLKIEFLLWLLGFSEKPASLKKIELKYRVNLDYLQQSTATQELANFSRVGKSVQREFLQGLLWDKGGIFDGMGKESAQRKQLLDALFKNIFKGKPDSSFEKKMWDLFFEKAPERSWPITEKILTNMLGLLATVRQSGRDVDSSQMTALMLAASGVVGMKLGQLLHSFGFVSEEFKNQLEALKSNSPVPFMKRDLFRMLEYYGMEDVRVFNKLGEASIKAVYRVERGGKQYAFKVKKPFVDREAEDGLAILGSMMQGLEALGPAERGAFELPQWLVNFLHRTIHDELDFAAEVRSAKSLKGQMKQGARLSNLWNLLRALVAYEGGWFSLEAWKKIWQKIRSGRAPGLWQIGIKDSYTADEWLGREPGSVPGIILDDLVMNASDYTKTPAEETAGLEDDIAPGFMVSLSKGFYHADLHEGNIMVERGGVHRAWLLDTGAMGIISGRDLRNVALLFRALGRKDASGVRKGLAGLFESVETSGADLERIIGEAFLKDNVIQGVLHLLKELKGEPRYDFLQLIKAFTAAGFIMRHLSVIPKVSQAAPAAQPAAEETRTVKIQPAAAERTVSELVDLVISDRTAAEEKTDALRRLSKIAEGIQDRWSRTDEQRELSRVTDAVLTEIIANKDYPDDLRGAAFRLFSLLIAKSSLSEGRANDVVYGAEYSPGIKKHSLALMQELIERDALGIQPEDTGRLDYLEGMLMVYAAAGDLQNREDYLEREHVERLREIALDSRFGEGIRALAGRLLVQRLGHEYSGLKADEVISSALLELWRQATPESARVELAMLTAYQEKNSDRLFEVPQFNDYAEARIASLFDGREAGPEQEVLLKIVIRGMQYLNNQGAERYREYVARFIFGSGEGLAARFSRVFELMSARQEQAAETLIPLMEFAAKFTDYLASSLRDGGDWLPEVAADQSRAILDAGVFRAALQKLEAVQAFALEGGRDNLSVEAWRVFQSLWSLALRSDDAALMARVRESWKAQRDHALTAQLKKSGDSQDWASAPAYMHFLSEFAGSFEVMRMGEGIGFSSLIRSAENRILVRDSAAQGLEKVIADLESNRLILADKRTQSNVASLVQKLVVLYLNTALFDHSTGDRAAAVMPDDAERARLRSILSGLFRLALNDDFPLEFRSQLLLRHFDLELVPWRDTAGSYFGGYLFDAVREHPYFAQNRDEFYSAAKEALGRKGLAPDLIEVSDRDTRYFYYALVRYFTDHGDPSLASDARFVESVKAIRTVFETWRSRQINGGASEPNTLLLLESADRFLASTGPQSSSLGSVTAPLDGANASVSQLMDETSRLVRDLTAGAPVSPAELSAAVDRLFSRYTHQGDLTFREADQLGARYEFLAKKEMYLLLAQKQWDRLLARLTNLTPLLSQEDLDSLVSALKEGGVAAKVVAQFIAYFNLNFKRREAFDLYAKLKFDFTARGNLASLKPFLRLHSFAVHEGLEQGRTGIVDRRLQAGRRMIRERGPAGASEWSRAVTLREALKPYGALTLDSLINLATVFYRDHFDIDLIIAVQPDQATPDGNGNLPKLVSANEAGPLLERLAEWSEGLESFDYGFIAMNPYFGELEVASEGRASHGSNVQMGERYRMKLYLGNDAGVLAHEFGHAIDPRQLVEAKNASSPIYANVNPGRLGQLGSRIGYPEVTRDWEKLDAEMKKKRLANLIGRIYRERMTAWDDLFPSAEFYDRKWQSGELGLWESYLSDLQARMQRVSGDLGKINALLGADERLKQKYARLIEEIGKKLAAGVLISGLKPGDPRSSSQIDLRNRYIRSLETDTIMAFNIAVGPDFSNQYLRASNSGYSDLAYVFSVPASDTANMVQDAQSARLRAEFAEYVAESVRRYLTDPAQPGLRPDSRVIRAIDPVGAELMSILFEGSFDETRSETAGASLGREEGKKEKPRRQAEWSDAQWDRAVEAAVTRLRNRAGDPAAPVRTADVVAEMAAEAVQDPAYDPSLRRVLSIGGFNAAVRRIKRTSGLDLVAKHGIVRRAAYARWDASRWKEVIREAVAGEIEAGRAPNTAHVAAAIRQKYPRERGDFTAEKLRQLEYDKMKRASAIDLRALGVEIEAQNAPWKKEDLEAAVARAVDVLDRQNGVAAGAAQKPLYGTRQITEAINGLGLRSEPLSMGVFLRTADRYEMDLRKMRVRIISPGPRWSTETWISRIRGAVARIRDMEVVEPTTEAVAYIMTGMLVEEVMLGRPIPEGFKEITAVKLNSFEAKHLPFEDLARLEDLGVSKRDLAPAWSADQWERAVDLAVQETAARGISEPDTGDVAEIISELSGTVPELGPARTVSVRQLGQATRAYGIDLSRSGVRVIRSVAGAVALDEDREDRPSRHETTADPAALGPAALAEDDDWFEYLLGFFTPAQQDMMREFREGKLGVLNLEMPVPGETEAETDLRLARLAEWQKMKLVLAFFLGNEMGMDTEKIAALLSAGPRTGRAGAGEASSLGGTREETRKKAFFDTFGSQEDRAWEVLRLLRRVPPERQSEFADLVSQKGWGIYREYLEDIRHIERDIFPSYEQVRNSLWESFGRGKRLEDLEMPQLAQLVALEALYLAGKKEVRLPVTGA
ncbi:MAG: hypothetical protein HY714_06545 [Candidatus Omnitrophica bacterium]|nr:hypothetical protein [Candidatus Omnitrophota bacterium]